MKKRGKRGTSAGRDEQAREEMNKRGRHRLKYRARAKALAGNSPLHARRIGRGARTQRRRRRRERRYGSRQRLRHTQLA
eukprot:3513198-Pleurochrysis_carterae.AAC.1